MKKSESRTDELYREAMGKEAAERQKKLAKDYHTCCWTQIGRLHHVECKSRDARRERGEL